MTYVTITVPREIETEILEDIKNMKNTLEERHNSLELEVLIEEGKQRE